MTESGKDYLKSWDDESIVAFFSTNRQSIEDVYPSERYFLDKYLRPDMKVLDYGCAAGGFSHILHSAYSVPPENFWGIDQSQRMISAARKTYRASHFGTQLSEVQKKDLKFDLVFSFGVLHMTLDWEKILRALYDLSLKYVIFDLRVVDDGPTIEDISRSFQTLGHVKNGNEQGAPLNVPYIVLNRSDLNDRLNGIVGKDDVILRYGYRHPVSETVTSPYKEVDMEAFCLIKRGI